MIEASPQDLAAYEGKSLGSSGWMLVDQGRINTFAQATGDHNWIHVDTERARQEMPGGKTIAHGFLSLSLIPMLLQEVLLVSGGERILNYGLNKVRFITPVAEGSHVRLELALRRFEAVEQGYRLTFACTLALQDQPNPALVAEMLILIVT